MYPKADRPTPALAVTCPARWPVTGQRSCDSLSRLRAKPRGGAVAINWIEIFGYAGAFLTLGTFAMAKMIPLRIIGIGAIVQHRSERSPRRLLLRRVVCAAPASGTQALRPWVGRALSDSLRHRLPCLQRSTREPLHAAS